MAWGGAASLTDHRVAAALLVARLADQDGNDRASLKRAYARALTDGTHDARALHDAEELLRLAGLVIADAGATRPDPRLAPLCRLPEPEAIVLMRTLLTVGLSGGRTAEEHRAEIGAAGEVEVVRACQAELEALGEPGLAAAVQRVSLLNDALGYDVHAPTLAGPARHLEVKTQSGAGAVVRFFLSRNEYDTGLRNPSGWALVACRLGEAGDVRVLGWCRARSLAPYLPADRNGRWTEALANVPPAVLHTGLPPA